MHYLDANKMAGEKARQQLHKNAASNIKQGGCPRVVMVKAMVCEIVAREFELQSRYYVHFQTKYPWERYEPPYPTSYGLNSATTVLLGEWLWH